jgi:IMP dehydrogenase
MQEYEHLTYDDVNIKPVFSDVASRNEVELSTRLTRNITIDEPWVSAPMDTVSGPKMLRALDEKGGVGCLHRFYDNMSGKMNEVIGEVSPFVVSMGMDGRFYDWVEAFYLIQSYVGYTIDAILIDVAHGHHEKMKKIMSHIQEYPMDTDIIAGNVATAEGAVDLASWGADAIRLGIGNGSVCTTRIKTGIGVPQVTAIMQAVDGLRQAGYDDVPIIADGGVRSPGDIAKALAAGADSAMIGSLLSGTKEAPGDVEYVDGEKYKKYEGSASKGENYVEGVKEKVRFKGPVEDVLKNLRDGLRSSFSYVGARDVDEFRANAELIRVSTSGHIEGKPHLKT